MEAWKHILVWLVFSLGMFLSSVLVDSDHSGNFSQKWKCLTKNECSDNMRRGFLHNPVVQFCLLALFYGLAIGLTFHMLMDNIKFIT